MFNSAIGAFGAYYSLHVYGFQGDDLTNSTDLLKTGSLVLQLLSRHLQSEPTEGAWIRVKRPGTSSSHPAAKAWMLMFVVLLSIYASGLMVSRSVLSIELLSPDSAGILACHSSFSWGHTDKNLICNPKHLRPQSKRGRWSSAGRPFSTRTCCESANAWWSSAAMLALSSEVWLREPYCMGWGSSCVGLQSCLILPLRFWATFE